MSTVSASPAREPLRVDQFDDPKKRWKKAFERWQ
jgi:hypothetical protein